MVYSIENGVLKINGTANKGTIIVLANNIFFKKGTYTHSINDIKSAMFFSFDNLKNTMLRVVSETKIKNITFQLAEDTIFERYVLWVDNGTSFNNEKFYLQTEPNSTATDYIAHAEQNAPLSLGNIEAYEGDEIQIDYVQKAGHKKVTGARLVQNMGKLVLNGSETGWDLKDNSTEKAFYRYRFLSNFVATTTDLKCNMFVPAPISTTGTNLGCSITNTGECRFREETMRTIEDWKTFLATNNLVLVYPHATPVTTPITDPTLLAQLETLINMKTYKTITNIYLTGEDLAPVLEFNYYKDMTTIFDNLEARVELLEN